MRRLLVAIVVLGVFIFSCKKDKTLEVNCFEEVSYAQEIQPLIEMNCTVSGCHDVAEEGGYNFTSYESVFEHADLILASITHGSGVTPMPLGEPKLADSLIVKFICWKNSGKLEN